MMSFIHPNHSSLLLLGTFLLFVSCQAQSRCKINSRCKPVLESETTKEEYFQGIIGSQDGKVVNLAGSNLRSELTSRIGRDFSRVSYQKCGYVALEEIDESKSDKNKVTAFYSRVDIPKENCYQGGNEPDSWNKEHIYPKSRWGGSKNDAYSDLHHLVATDSTVNSDRDRNDFKEDPNNKPVTDKDTIGRDQKENLIQCPECKETENRYWEPAPGQKGQVARMLFYMDIRYDDTDANGFNLQLIDVNYEGNQDTTIYSGTNKLGDLTSLLNWHCAEGVTEDERTRNDMVQKWQGNRNPFIDYPELVELIYGKKCDNSSTTINTPPADQPRDDGDFDEGTTTIDTSSKTFNVRIISALVNPDGNDGDEGSEETVTIKNYGNETVNIKGWKIAGNNNQKSLVAENDYVLRPGSEYTIPNLGKNGGAQLRNKANSDIILYDNNENEVSKVTYTSKPQSAVPITFSHNEL